MTRGEVSYRWRKLDNKFVPSYQLERMINSVRTSNAVAGWNGEVIVAQDINKERWLWGFTLRKSGSKDTVNRASGHADTLEEAQEAAADAAGRIG
jgi:hypothetical protein